MTCVRLCYSCNRHNCHHGFLRYNDLTNRQPSPKSMAVHGYTVQISHMCTSVPAVTQRRRNRRWARPYARMGDRRPDAVAGPCHCCLPRRWTALLAVPTLPPSMPAPGHLCTNHLLAHSVCNILLQLCRTACAGCRHLGALRAQHVCICIATTGAASLSSPHPGSRSASSPGGNRAVDCATATAAGALPTGCAIAELPICSRRARMNSGMSLVSAMPAHEESGGVATRLLHSAGREREVWLVTLCCHRVWHSWCLIL